MTRSILIFLTGVMSCLAVPGVAAATVGDIAFADCLTNGPTTTGCTDLSPAATALNNPNEAIAFGPGAIDVYIPAEGDGAVTHLRRGPSGALTFADCVSGGAAPAPGCTDVSATTNSLLEVNSLTASADGRDVYASGGGGSGNGAVVHLKRNATTGKLTFADCISSNVGATGCTHINGTTTVLDGVESVALSGDGRNLYAGTNVGGGNLVRLTRNEATGVLAFADCVSGSAVPPCTNISGTTTALSGPPQSPLAVTGTHVYGTVDGSSVVHFKLGAGGALTFADCVSSSGAATCGVAPANALGLGSIALSPDGTSAYSTGGLNTLSQLTRNTTTGALTFVRCITSGADVPGCTNIHSGGDELLSPQALVVSPDGLTVYVGGGVGVTQLSRNPGTGALTFVRCITGSAAVGCSNTGATSNSLSDLQAIVVSPDGKDLYTTADGTEAVVHLRRQVPPVCKAAHVNVAAPAPATVPLQCSDANGDPVTVSVASSPAHGSITAIDKSTSSVIYFPAPGYGGPDSFTFRATAAGDTSAPATATLTVAKDVKAPVVSALSVTPGVFAAAKAKVRKSPRGTTFRFTISEAAVLTFTIERRVVGRKVGKRCEPVRKSNRSKRHCTRFVRVARLTQLSAPGKGTRRFSGRVGKAKRKLGPGRYRVRLRATDAAGNRSKLRSASFRLVPR